MVKTIELKKSDYDYYEQYGMYRIKSGHYEKHPPCEIYITKRCGNKENYWGFLGEDDEEYKIKWIEDVGLKCGHPHEKERDYGNNYCYSCEMESVFAPPPAGICPETGKKLYEKKFLAMDYKELPPREGKKKRAGNDFPICVDNNALTCLQKIETMWEIMDDKGEWRKVCFPNKKTFISMVIEQMTHMNNED